jgi:hypothetical protein
MAVKAKTTEQQIHLRPKKSRQGDGKHTKFSATSRNGARKKSRGQGC